MKNKFGLAVVATILAISLGLYYVEPRNEKLVVIDSDVIGTIESVSDRENLAETELEIISGGIPPSCSLQIRVEDQLVPWAPEHSVCEKAEPGQSVTLKKIVTTTHEGEVKETKYRVPPTA
ncbi:MAG: hypothetical protein RLZZ26_545 [Candidatus Parcubacteria bacterium]|jgi:hypothetical protein